MAKTPKYDDDLLLEAVVKYAEVYNGKIKTTELAEWARKNINGLEEVRYYNFQRPLVEKNKRKGKTEKKERPCTLRLVEINKARAMHKAFDANVLLKSSDLDEFLTLSDSDRRLCIISVRQKMEELVWKNNKLELEIETVRSEKQFFRDENERLTADIHKIKNELKEINLFIHMMKNQMNDANKQEAFSKMGIEAGYLSLVRRAECLTEAVDEIFRRKETENKYENRDSKAFVRKLMADILEEEDSDE